MERWPEHAAGQAVGGGPGGRGHGLRDRRHRGQGRHLREEAGQRGEPRAHGGRGQEVEAAGPHVHAPVLSHLRGYGWPHLRGGRRRRQGLAVFSGGL